MGNWERNESYREAVGIGKHGGEYGRSVLSIIDKSDFEAWGNRWEIGRV